MHVLHNLTCDIGCSSSRMAERLNNRYHNSRRYTWTKICFNVFKKNIIYRALSTHLSRRHSGWSLRAVAQGRTIGTPGWCTWRTPSRPHLLSGSGGYNGSRAYGSADIWSLCLTRPWPAPLRSSCFQDYFPQTFVWSPFICAYTPPLRLPPWLLFEKEKYFTFSKKYFTFYVTPQNSFGWFG